MGRDDLPTSDLGEPDVTVDAATHDDRETLVDLALGLHEAHRPLHPLQRSSDPSEFAAAVTRLLDDPTQRVTVARREDGCVVGYAVATAIERPRTHLLETSTVIELDQLAVHPEARGAGVGRLLAEDVLAHARSTGASDVLLTVWAANDGARRLYESLGFAVRQHRMGVWLRD